MTTIVSINLVLAILIVSAVVGIVWLSHRLPTDAPRSDQQWGRGGDPWVQSDPLPLHQVARHEADRTLGRAA